MLGALLFLVLAVGGCSTLRAQMGGTKGSSPVGEATERGMTQSDLELAFGENVDAIDGQPGAIRSQIDGVNVYLISDPVNDRMRLIVRVARDENLDVGALRVLLQANFHSTLDCRYAISGGIIYASFIHPLSSLTREEFDSALRQVVSLQRTFGTSFSSGEMVFGTPTNQAR
jgi:hypothetical protein